MDVTTPSAADDLFEPPPSGIHLFFRGGSRDETSLTIDRCGRYLLGRAADADIRFDDRDDCDRRVSQRHAVLRVEAGAVWLANCSPRNGVKIDGILLDDFQELELHDSDVIALGTGGPIIRIRIGSLAGIAGKA
ncbi:MAG: FHA domain-containing protein [Planctomycetaceae bacterium]|nr:FHA domain-containing protein [Planctomycetaceae bacterium]